MGKLVILPNKIKFYFKKLFFVIKIKKFEVKRINSLIEFILFTEKNVFQDNTKNIVKLKDVWGSKIKE